MLPTALRLFARARTPEALAQLTPKDIDRLISACSFHERKAQQIHWLAQRVMHEHQGALPCQAAVLLSFAGVGPKCANLVLGLPCRQPRIGVDIHVHRITNRWGYVKTSSPDKSVEALEAKLPREYWVEIKRLLARAFWQAHLHREPPALFGLPHSRHVPAGRRVGCALNSTRVKLPGHRSHEIYTGRITSMPVRPSIP